jgi:cobalt-zinc-cadmium efflux system protein
VNGERRVNDDVERATGVEMRHDAAGNDPADTHRHEDEHGHRHGHDHGHGHGHAGALTARNLWLAVALTGGFAVVEAVGGLLSGSLALLSDAGHMATDAASFVVALIAQWVAGRPPSERATFGYARAEVLAAFVNALAMLALVVWIAVAAVHRLFAPEPVVGPAVMAVALAGLAVNVVVALLLARAGDGINARGALLHVMGDLLGSVAALVAGAVVHFTGWLPIDPLLSLLVALLILRATWTLLRQSGGVLMERVPPHLPYAAIGQALASIRGVEGVHDLHVWRFGSTRVALSAHVAIEEAADWPRVLADAQQMLALRFGIDHVTLQPSWPCGTGRPAAVIRLFPRGAAPSPRRGG